MGALAYYRVEESPRFSSPPIAEVTRSRARNFSLLLTHLSFMCTPQPRVPKGQCEGLKAREAVEATPCFPQNGSSVLTPRFFQKSFVGCFMKVDQKFSSVHTPLISSILATSPKMQEAHMPSSKAGQIWAFSSFILGRFEE